MLGSLRTAREREADGGWFDGLTTSGLGAYSRRIVTAFRLLRDAGTPGRWIPACAGMTDCWEATLG